MRDSEPLRAPEPTRKKEDGKYVFEISSSVITRVDHTKESKLCEASV